MLKSFSLAGKAVLLTGAAGLYGRTLAGALASAGARLIVASRNLDSCAQVAEEERAKGYDVRAMSFDQASEASIVELRGRIQAEFGRLDGLVNNSVIRSMQREDAPVEDWELSMRVNATGVWLMHRYFGGMMAMSGGGSIVNISSIQGTVGPDFTLYEGTDMGTPPPDYFFHKAGMNNLTRYYAALLGRSQVRVNGVIPGGFFNNQPERFVRNYEQKTYLGRMAREDDLGGPVVFLLSDASAYMTGSLLYVDGGYTAH
jgi:NAD(P)-dependent dehydrogenase (short-subunit alcohol dehydrogenase family)